MSKTQTLCSYCVPTDLGSSPGGSVGSHWVLDPIDGTRGFVGMRQYAVCLGLIQDEEVVVGVLGCPNLPQGQVTDDDCGTGERQAHGCGPAAGPFKLVWGLVWVCFKAYIVSHNQLLVPRCMMRLMTAGYWSVRCSSGGSACIEAAP